MFPRRLTQLLSVAAVLALPACGSDDESTRDGPRVVATTTHVADFARAVGGDRIAVDQLLAANTDPHGYEPRPDDVRAVSEGRVVFTSGAGLDGWSHDLAARAGGEAQVVDLSSGLPVERGGDGHSHEGPADEHAEEEHAEDEERDPHWWHDTRNARAAVERIRDELVRVDPAGAADYRRNAGTYLAKIERLDTGIERCLDAIPEGERKLVTDHDAFGYLADRYDIEVVGTVIPSQTTEGQASAGEIAELARVIEREDVQAIFPEASLDPGVARALADQTNITAEYTLYGDTLGREGSRGWTYLTMEEANADAIVRGLSGGRHGCQVTGID